MLCHQHLRPLTHHRPAPLPACRLSLLPLLYCCAVHTHTRTPQVLYKVYEAAELQPFLDAANAEKEAAASS